MHNFDFPAGVATAKTPVLLMVGSFRMFSVPSCQAPTDSEQNDKEEA